MAVGLRALAGWRSATGRVLARDRALAPWPWSSARP